MAYTAEFWNFQKRKNSTKQPAANTAVTYDVALKNPTSFKTPVITLSAETFNYSYARFQNRYYFVNDIIAVRNNLYEIHLQLDALATYKTEIGNTTAFVVYDTSTNTELTDSRLSTKTEIISAVEYAGGTMFVAPDTIVLGIIGQNEAGVFIVPESIAKQLMNSIVNWLDNSNVLPLPVFPSVGSWSDVILAWECLCDTIQIVGHNLQATARTLVSTGKASDCVKSSWVLPINSAMFTGSTKPIFLGQYNTGLSGKLLTMNQKASEIVYVDIPWSFTDWRRNSPYTEVYLYMPYAGIAKIPTSNLIGVTRLAIDQQCTASGQLTYEVSASVGGTSKVILTAGGNCASDYMIGSSIVSPFSAAVSGAAAIGATAAAIATGGAALPVLTAAGATASAYATNNNMGGLPCMVGAAGGGAFTSGEQCVCFTICHDTNIAPDSVSGVIGTPAMAVKTIGNLSGYVQTSQASVSVDTFDDIRIDLNNALNGGIFYE